MLEQVSEPDDGAQRFGQVVAGRVGKLRQVLIGAGEFGVGSFEVGRVRGDHDGGVGDFPAVPAAAGQIGGHQAADEDPVDVQAGRRGERGDGRAVAAGEVQFGAIGPAGRRVEQVDQLGTVGEIDQRGDVGADQVAPVTADQVRQPAVHVQQHATLGHRRCPFSPSPAR